MVDVIPQHIEVVQGASGPKARIAGHRIRVQDVVIWHERLGWSADEIVQQYPTLTHADVYAALTYYWDHHDEIERAIAEERAFVEDFRQRNPSPLQAARRRGRLPEDGPSRERGQDDESPVPA
jgi:uncharacterized protein (DUF433 family)